MTSWPTHYFNWVTTFRTADAPSADRQLAVELSWVVSLCTPLRRNSTRRRRGSLLQCSDFPIKMHYGELVQNRGRENRILTLNEVVLSLLTPNNDAKFHQNRVKIATVGARTAERQTDRQKDASDFIIYPMLCYNNRTGKNKLWCEAQPTPPPAAT